MKGMHKTRCIYFSEPPHLELQWNYLHRLQAIIPMHLFGQLSFKYDVNQNIDHWKCVTVYTLRFTLRPSSLTLRCPACYATVHTRISNQASCVKTKSRRRYLTPQLYSQQSKLLIPMWKKPLTCNMIPQWPQLFLTRFRVRHVVWSVTYVTLLRVPTVMLSPWTLLSGVIFVHAIYLYFHWNYMRIYIAWILLVSSIHGLMWWFDVVFWATTTWAEWFTCC